MTAKTVQVRNPVTDRYHKVSRVTGRIVQTKKSPGPFKGVPVAKRRESSKA